jgi:hypothetical protein
VPGPPADRAHHGAILVYAVKAPGMSGLDRLPLTAENPMSKPTPGSGATPAEAPPAPSNASTGALLGDLSDQITRLARDEVRLAQAEVTGKAQRLGVGAGLFGGAGLVALLGLNAPITAAIIGKKDVQQAAPPLPTGTMESVKTDVATVKERGSR